MPRKASEWRRKALPKHSMGVIFWMESVREKHSRQRDHAMRRSCEKYCLCGEFQVHGGGARWEQREAG